MNYEKLSVNVNNESLALIDLLVDERLFSNRSDFINQAIKEKLMSEKETTDKLLEIHSISRAEKSINENSWFIGVSNLTKGELQILRNKKIKISIKGFGCLYVDDDIDISLFKDTIKYVCKMIKVVASKEIVNYVSTIR